MSGIGPDRRRRQQGDSMNRIAATSVALVATLTMTAAPASAVPVGPLAVTTSSLSINTSTACATVPITWYLASAPSDTSTWSVMGDIVDSAGASRGSIFEYETLPVTQAGSTYTICGLAEGTTTFTVAADVDAWSASYSNNYSTRFTGSLTVTRTTPPPPPPVTINTQLVINGRPIWLKRDSFARLIAGVEFRGACRSGPRDLALVGRRASGRWKVIGKATVNSSERTSVRSKVPYSFRKVRLEVSATQGTSVSCTADQTAAFRVPRRG